MSEAHIGWMIRDSRGLDYMVIGFLRQIDSRGSSMIGTAETVMADMGLSEGSFYRWRKAAVRSGTVTATPRDGKATEYQIVVDELVKHVPYESAIKHKYLDRLTPEQVELLAEGSARSGGGVRQIGGGGPPDQVVEGASEASQEGAQRMPHPDIAKAPCFDCLGCGCPTCLTDRCWDHGGTYLVTECDYCIQQSIKADAEAKHPDFKKKDWHDGDMADEGLNEFGEPLGMDC